MRWPAMVAKHSSFPTLRRPTLAVFGLSVLLAVGLAATGDPPGSAGAPATAGPVASHVSLPVHQPHEWAFWDQMASAFSVVPMPDDLYGGPGVSFRWWFDRTLVGTAAGARGLDLTPFDCDGIARWAGEFERYGFDEGARFARLRWEPCRS